MLFVPKGWWHMVINSEETLAITHNFTTIQDIKEVVRWLRGNMGSLEAISGVDKEKVRSISHSLNFIFISSKKHLLLPEIMKVLEDHYPAIYQDLEVEGRVKNRKVWKGVDRKSSESFSFKFFK